MIYSVLSPVLNMPISDSKRQRVLVASCVLYSEVSSLSTRLFCYIQICAYISYCALFAETVIVRESVVFLVFISSQFYLQLLAYKRLPIASLS